MAYQEITETPKSETQAVAHPAAWLAEAKCGIMVHYLWRDHASQGDPIAEWNDQVDAFDVDRLVRTLKYIGAGYLIFTTGQNSGYYCTPNAGYDQLVGLPSRLSKRDLMADVARACQKAGIRFISYATFSAPCNQPEAVERLGFVAQPPGNPGQTEVYLRRAPGAKRPDAQINWESVLREWSLRWGDLVDGWWIDGAEFSDGKVTFADKPDYQALADAMKAGNPRSIITSNPGTWIPVGSRAECDDYTAGETNVLPTHNMFHPIGREYPGRVYHILSFLGDFWCDQGKNAPRYPDDLVIAYTRYITDRGGAVTWDVSINAEGEIPEPFVEQARKICHAVRPIR